MPHKTTKYHHSSTTKPAISKIRTSAAKTNHEHWVKLKETREKLRELGAEEESKEWIGHIIRTFGIEPHEWQVEYTYKLVKGEDIFLTAGTGSGKSTLVHAAVLATQLLERPCRAIVVEP